MAHELQNSHFNRCIRGEKKESVAEMITQCVTAHHAYFLKMKIKTVYVQKDCVVVHIWAYRSRVAG